MGHDLNTEKYSDKGSVGSEDGLPPTRLQKYLAKVTYFLTRWGVDTTGIGPIPAESRTDPKLFQMFFVWFPTNMNVLGFGTGSAGPAFFGLGLKQSLIILAVVDVIACTIPAYFTVFGPKLGARSMVQARFSWGYWGAMLPSAMNVFSMQGFLIFSCIIGGQVLASVSHRLNDSVGIVIIAIISMLVTFCGYRFIHWCESVAWIPNVITFIIMLGVGGKYFVDAPPTVPVTVSSVVTFATTIASSVVSWCTMTPDYGVYHDAKASSLRIFLYAYAGFFIAIITVHYLGAVFAASATSVPAWEAGFDHGSNVGGLVEAVLSSLGGFGKFLTVLLVLTVPSACAPTTYTFGSSFMTIGTYFAKVPRYAFVIVLIPVAIFGATSSYDTFVDILSIIGYWSTVWATIVLAEHFIFRWGSWSRYNMEDLDTAQRLPWGVATLLAFGCAFGIIIPSMSQVWYAGPIALAGTGDIGILVGAGVGFVAYLALRCVEKALSGR